MAVEGRRKSIPNKLSLLAHADMDRLGVNPIEMLKSVYDRAIKAYDDARGYGDKSDAGVGYLAVAGKAAADLAKFKHPTLSAVALKDMSDPREEAKPMTTQEAVKVIQADPFAPKIKASDVVDAMTSQIQVPSLPGGSKEKT